MKKAATVLSLVSVLALTNCGRGVPNLAFNGEDQVFVEDVHLAIRCELIAAIHEANRQAAETPSLRKKSENFFNSWAVKYTLTLVVVENFTANLPLGGISDSPTPPPTGIPGNTVATVGLGAGYSSKATRTETDQSSRTVDYYAKQMRCSEGKKNKIVPNGSGLGFGGWLRTRLSLVDRNVIPPISKADTFTYKIQFDIARTGNFSPTWTFVQSPLNSVAAPLTGGRSTAHSVLVTFGPVESPAQPTLAKNAEAVHNANIIGAAITQ